MTHHRPAPGPHARQVARHLVRLRGERGWTRGELAYALVATDAPLTADAIARIEAGADPGTPMRQVNLDEFMALAQAFGVQPAELLDEPACPECRDDVPDGTYCAACGRTG